MRRVLILGASGTGTSTLGLALGSDLSFQVFDTDDYYWLSSTPPFQRKQDPGVRLANLLQDLNSVSHAIISGSILNWGPELEDSLSQYDQGKMSGRSREKHEQWLARRSCPILRIDGDSSTVDRVARVRAAIAEL